MNARNSLENIFAVLEELLTLDENPMVDHQSLTEVNIKRKTHKKVTKVSIEVTAFLECGFAVLFFDMDDTLLTMTDAEIEGRILNFDDPNYDFVSDDTEIQGSIDFINFNDEDVRFVGGDHVAGP